MSQFLASGALLPRAAVTPEGLSLWATEREKFVGVLLRDAAEPSFGAVQRPLRRAILEGRHALVWGAAGFAKQSVDGGQTFSELTLPYRSGDPELASVTHPSSALLMGCTEVGCALGRLLKIGWDIPSETVAALPKARSFTIPGPSRFRFTCGRGPVKSGPRREGGSPDFPDFWEERAPLIPPGSEGLSVGFSGGLAQFYAWGPLEQGWARSGWAQAFFIDPWSPGKVRKTAATRQFFGSYLEAQTKLGIVDRISGVRYQAMDPEGDGGVMVVRGRTATELFVYDEGKPLESFGGGDELGSRNLIGAVRSRGVFVAAFSHGATLSLARLSDGEQKPLVDFPLGESGKRGVSLVRTEQGDLGIAMEGDVGLFIYPVSDDGDLGQPLVLPHASDRPASCPSEATGFIVDRELGVAPYLETTSGAPLPVTRVRERLIVGYGKACIAGLAGVARDLTPPSEAASHAQSIVLSILDTDSSGQRFELLCE